MAREVLVMVGTKKGAFLFRSTDGKKTWTQSGPLMNGMEINHLTRDPRDGSLLAAANSDFYGPSVRRSTDLGETWDQGGTPAYGPDDKETVDRVWHLVPGPADHPGEIYAGVEASGLFRTTDGGATWEEVGALREHPTHELWGPGNGGKCLHTIALDPSKDGRIFTACSTGGLYRTEDRGETWQPRNEGIRADFLPEGQQFPVAGQCVHKFSLSPALPGRIYLQNHGGVYRSDDSGDTWNLIATGLPSDFGFPVVAHPTRPDTAFVIPLEGPGRYSPEGRLSVFRTDDAGGSWRRLANGLPEEVYSGVLRDAFAIDSEGRAGLYFATTSGSVFASPDEGESWQEVGRHLPRALSVEVAVI